MSKKRTKTHFDLEFKKRAVLLTQKEGVTLTEVANELGVSQQNLSTRIPSFCQVKSDFR